MIRTINCECNTADHKKLVCYGDFHRSISEPRLPQYEASKYLFALADAAKQLEFSGREYICGGNLVTYLSVTRARVVPCMCQRLTDFQRALLTGSTSNEIGTLVVSLLLQPFPTSRKYFLFVDFDQVCRELRVRNIWVI